MYCHPVTTAARFRLTNILSFDAAIASSGERRATADSTLAGTAAASSIDTSKSDPRPSSQAVPRASSHTGAKRGTKTSGRPGRTATLSPLISIARTYRRPYMPRIARHATSNAAGLPVSSLTARMTSRSTLPASSSLPCWASHMTSTSPLRTPGPAGLSSGTAKTCSTTS